MNIYIYIYNLFSHRNSIVLFMLPDNPLVKGLLAKIRNSICSYPFNIWYVDHRPHFFFLSFILIKQLLSTFFFSMAMSIYSSSSFIYLYIFLILEKSIHSYNIQLNTLLAVSAINKSIYFFKNLLPSSCVC